ncbi:hypothetical protein OI18_22405 [Flavihumibacter solisilvae]|uniref:Beta-lactamase n=1 Tax=Flavihumibacter solisilvae TaxID=1349421 RepID=A0A0C1IBE3_9BACT|nr:hypothetical protein OI18_22405 [Flavihumibacter solisilvae]
MGTWYLFGRYVKKSYVQAVKYLKKAALLNFREAFYDLAVCYELGEGVKKNEKKAFEYYLKAALMGNKTAIHEVGRCYYYGIGIEKNRAISKIWIKQSETD